jgi:sugar O-acyltransferase (sialic acid O-acetyltransferase NeuD family)
VTAQGVYVAGTRTFAAEVASFAEDAGLRVIGLLEPFERERVGQTIHGFDVSWLEDGPGGGPNAVLTGTGELARRDIVGRLEAVGWRPVSLVHPRAQIAASSTVGIGAIVGPGVVVGAYSPIGEHAVLGRGVLVGHHTKIGPFATLGPGANVAGNVRVGADAHIAMGALVRDHLTIGSSAVVAMGAVVIADVADGAQVFGFPARGAGTSLPPDAR